MFISFYSPLYFLKDEMTLISIDLDTTGIQFEKRHAKTFFNVGITKHLVM